MEDVFIAKKGPREESPALIKKLTPFAKLCLLSVIMVQRHKKAKGDPP